jgi:hypothetical protein
MITSDTTESNEDRRRLTSDELTNLVANLGGLVLRSMDDPSMFAQDFQPSFSWDSWRVVIKVIFGLPLDDDETALFRKCSGRTRAFGGPLKEAWLMCGRQSGKSAILALIAVCLACFRSDYARYLRSWQRARIMCLAANKKQAETICGYAKGMIEGNPMLAAMLEREPTKTTIDLNNRVTIEVRASSFKSIRGPTCIAVLADEAAFWTDAAGAANPAKAVLGAAAPTLGRIQGSMLLVASSVYARFGVVYDTFSDTWGKNESPRLCWKATTKEMNPTFEQAVIDAEHLKDPQNAASEYFSEFRGDLSTFIPEEAITDAIMFGTESLSMDRGLSYQAFVDHAGGAEGGDGASVSVAHKDRDGRIVIDHVEHISGGHVPQLAVRQFAQVLRSYGLVTVTGDRYAGEWPANEYAMYGIGYIQAQKTASDIYLECLPLFTGKYIEIPQVGVLISELRTLVRKTGTGRDKVTHASGAHDDAANAACGAAWLVNNSATIYSEQGSNSITRALSEITHDAHPRRRPPPPPIGMGGYFGPEFEDFSQAIRDYDPLN